MRKSVVLLNVLVISGLMVMNVHSAILGGSRQTSENCSNLLLKGSSLEKSFNAVETEYVSSTWTGATSTKWNIAANWSDGTIPNSLTDVILTSAGFHPEIDSEAICHNLTILLGARLTIAESNILTVGGDFVNNGEFSRNSSTVIFNGKDQKVGKGPYHNLTLRGIGLKSILPISESFYYGTLSMEDSARVSATPYPGANSFLQYNTPYKITVGPEWPSLYVWGGITIKNTGTITLNGNKVLTNITPDGNTYRSGLTIEENATLYVPKFRNIDYPKAVNLKCGGLVKGSSIIGEGSLNLDDMQVNVIDAGNGTAGAMISCPVNFTGNNYLYIANDEPNVFSNNDLTISSSTGGGYFNKSGAGTLNLGKSVLNLTTLIIGAGNVTIPVDAQVKVSDGGIAVTPTNGLTIESDASGTGSLIVLKGSGFATVERFMTPGAWHMVSSPVSGQLISDFLGSNVSVPKGENLTRGMRDYNPVLDLWNNFFYDGTPGVLTSGKGYCMRVKTSEIHKVYFKGTLNIGDLLISGLTAGKWNCIGNPYTSAMRVNLQGTTSTFLAANSSNLDPLYGAIYIWDQTDESNGTANKYTIVSNATATCEIQQGQAFMVKMATGKTTINFKKVMQVPNSTLALKSTDGVWPTIKLKIMADSVFSSTLIAFGEGMNYGLDPTYDAGLLKAGDEMCIYTQLLEDEGIPFAIQALPADYESIVVPLGIDDANGGKVNFSAELLHVPPTCQAILEDRKNNILTDLSVKDYTADLEGSNSSQGRFFLHTSYTTTGINSKDRIQNFRAWAVSNREMKISGEVGTKATAKLYDTQGRLVLSEPLKAGLNHTIGLPEIKPGLYILQVEKMQHKQALKIIIRE